VEGASTKQKLFCLPIFCLTWATTVGRQLGLKMGKDIKCLSKESSTPFPSPFLAKLHACLFILLICNK